MRRFAIKYYLSSTVLILSLVFLPSCASFGPTKPNPVFQGPYPARYYELADKNPLLAKELGKLPEFQDGISGSEASALEHIVELYNTNPNSFNDGFEQMYQVGKPEVRKYCSPLQAVFWLAEDGVLNEYNPLVDYSLEELLIPTWPARVGRHRVRIPDYLLPEVIAGIKDEKNREAYARLITKISKFELQEMLLEDYFASPEQFSEKARDLIQDSLERRHIKAERWEDFDTIVDRLNDPKLVEFYLMHNVSYVKIDCPQEPEKTIKTGTGDCKAYAIVAYHCLHKAGYNAYMLSMVDPPNISAGHTVCVIDNSCTLDNTRGLLGPFNSEKEIVKFFGYKGLKLIREYGWGSIMSSPRFSRCR